MPPLFLGLLGAANPRLMGYCLAFTIGNILLTMPGNGMDFSIDGFLGRAIALLLGLSTVVMAFRLAPGLPTTIRKHRRNNWAHVLFEESCVRDFEKLNISHELEGPAGIIVGPWVI